MKKRLFIKNAMILTSTSLIIRGIGILFRIYLAARIGAQGMGLYQMVISLFTLAGAAGSGLPTTVTGQLSAMPNDRSRLRPLFFGVALSALALGLSALTFFTLAPQISTHLLSDARTALSLRILTLCLPFMGVSMCIKGYFIAQNKTGTPSSAQLFEQLVRIAVIVAALKLLGDAGLEKLCAAVILGDSAAEVASFFFMLTALYLDARRRPRSSGAKYSRREMLQTSLPVTGSRYLTTALRAAENIIIPICLAAYSDSSQEAIARFGMLKGMAIPLLFFPASFLGALSTLLLPEVARNYRTGNLSGVRTCVGGAMRTTLFAAMPIMGVFLTFGREISRLIYQSEGVGLIVVTLAPIVPFMYLECVCDGILKGLTQQGHSLLYNVIDSVLRLAAIWLLVPRYGLEGFLGIMIFSNILTSSLNIHRLLAVSQLRLPLGRFVFLPLGLTAAACAVGRLIAHGCTGVPYGFFLGIGATAAVYLAGSAILRQGESEAGRSNRSQRQNACRRC